MNSEHDQMHQWLSLTQAANVLGSTPLNVLMHIKRGLLTGVEKDGVWLIDPDALAELLRQRRQGESPAVCASGCTGAHGCKSCR